MNKENFTQSYVSNQSCRTITPSRTASVPKLIFISFVSLFYDLLETLRSKK